MTERQLQKLYQRLNDRFFFSRLPDDAVVKFANLNHEDADGDCEVSTKTIRIDQALRAHLRWATVVLLHEMAHLALPDYVGYSEDEGHGMRHQAELVRLFHIGAYDDLL